LEIVNHLIIGTDEESEKTQTSWTSPRPFNPGTYYVHVGAWNDAASDLIWSPTMRVSVPPRPLRAKWFNVDVSRKRDAASLSFDTRQCHTMNDNPPTIPAEITIRSSWRKRALRMRFPSACSIDDLGFRTFFGGDIGVSLSSIALKLEPWRYFSTDGTFNEKLTITGRVRGAQSEAMSSESDTQIRLPRRSGRGPTRS
jgi:hypothetical protein